MARSEHQPTAAELSILRCLWRRSPATIREITDTLYPDGGHSHYATVQSLLDRLEGKGHVSRKRSGRVNVFEPTVSRSELIVHRLRDTAESLCNGSLAPLLTHLVQGVELEEHEAQALEALVERLDSEPGEQP